MDDFEVRVQWFQLPTYLTLFSISLVITFDLRLLSKVR